MRSGIKEFQPRQPLDRQLGASTLNQILRELESLRITRVVNGTFRKLPGGTEITVAPQRGGSTPATRQPWDLIARVDPDSTAEPPPYLVSVRPGTLNGILPTNWDTVGANGAVDVPCAATGLHYAKAVIATDGIEITGVTIAIDTDPPVFQQSTESGFAASIEYLFGLFEEGAAYRLIGPGSISLDSSLYMITDKNPAPAPGESPYIFHYIMR